MILIQSCKEKGSTSHFNLRHVICKQMEENEMLVGKNMQNAHYKHQWWPPNIRTEDPNPKHLFKEQRKTMIMFFCYEQSSKVSKCQ